jgi:hypothetical protein
MAAMPTRSSPAHAPCHSLPAKRERGSQSRLVVDGAELFARMLAMPAVGQISSTSCLQSPIIAYDLAKVDFG